MGIKKLREFISTKFPHLIKQMSIYDLSGKKIAFDIATYAVKHKIVDSENWISNVFNYYCLFKKSNIHAITCFDGQTLPLKLNTTEARQNTRDKNSENIIVLTSDLQKYIDKDELSIELSQIIDKLESKSDTMKRLIPQVSTISENVLNKEDNIKLIRNHIEILKNRNNTFTKKDKKDLRDLIKLFGNTCIKCPYEAETIACMFAQYGDIDAVLSEDTDILAYGCKLSLWGLDFKTGICNFINFSELLSEMELTRLQFLDFCILCGTDYNTNISRIGPVKAFELIKKYNNLEKISTKYEMDHIKYIDIRKVFLFENYKKSQIVKICKKAKFTDSNIDIEKAFQYLDDKCIRYNKKRLTDIWKPVIVKFVENEI